MSGIEHQRGRATRETDTKMHENDTVFTWFLHGFSHPRDAQPPLPSALALPEIFCFSAVLTDLRNATPPRTASSRSCLRANAPSPCGLEHHLTASSRFPE